jgi:hypothetical protein
MTYGDFTGVGAGGPLEATFPLLEATVGLVVGFAVGPLGATVGNGG